MRKVYLHGALGRKFGKVHEFAVETAAEALRALTVAFPKFKNFFQGGSYHVVRGPSLNNGMSLDLDQFRELRLGSGDIHFAPAVKGAKNGGGILKIILGVALIGAALFVGVGVPLLGGLGVNATWGTAAMVGVGLVAGGVSQMLSGEETSDKKTESFTMSGPGNTYEQGLPIPLIYGRVITGTFLASGAIDIEDITK